MISPSNVLNGEEDDDDDILRKQTIESTLFES